MSQEETQQQTEFRQQKEVQFYKATVDAWYKSVFEHDKGLFTISSGGIGLLVTLLNSFGLPSAEALVLYMVAILSFLACLVVVLAIYKFNCNYLERVIHNEGSGDDPFLKKLDWIANVFFIIGVICTVIIGISTAIGSYANKEKYMGNDKSKQTSAGNLNESVNNALNLHPKMGDMTKSVNGAQNLQPNRNDVSSTQSTIALPPQPATNASIQPLSDSSPTQGNPKK